MTWMQRVRDGRLVQHQPKCWFRHQWQTHQYNVQADMAGAVFVIAWKQCNRCARSKLIHILI